MTVVKLYLPSVIRKSSQQVPHLCVDGDVDVAGGAGVVAEQDHAHAAHDGVRDPAGGEDRDDMV